MKILISSIGSRGDVQPILALAIEFRALGHTATLCVAPNFRTWVESFGIECVPIGPDLQQLAHAGRQGQPAPSAQQLQLLAGATVRSQFPVLLDAARGTDLVVGAGALQLATRSVTEALRIPYIFAAYCPVVLPSPEHPPPKIGPRDLPAPPAGTNASLWAQQEKSWNDLFGVTLNQERAKLDLDPIEDVQRHIFTDHPLLAADALLGPAARAAVPIVQTGAWVLDDPSPLAPEVEDFLANGPAPLYLGFGSMRAADDTGRLLVQAARALGLRCILSQGWGNLQPGEHGADCLLVGDLPHAKLFPRVAAVVHHGGAGTSTAAALAGASQIIIPHHYDQFYWAQRVEQLGIGAAGPSRDELSAIGLTAALERGLRPATTARALATASRIERRGARIAAERLVQQSARLQRGPSMRS
jgi:vancomycin aglycone glucosyltransferase